MSENVEIHEVPAKKARKAYTRKPVSEIKAAIAVPQAPNPNILAMESKIGELVEQRSQAQFAVSRAGQQAQMAQSILRSAQEEFSRLDGEIQYRMGLINQMRGGAAPQFQQGEATMTRISGPQYYAPTMTQSPPYTPNTPYPPYPPAFDPRMIPATGVGSAPAPNHGLYPDLIGNDEGAQVGDAEALRRDEMRVRGY